MANWTYTLDLKDEWGKSKRDEIPIYELARIISEKLKVMKEKAPEKHLRWFSLLEEIIEEFESFAEAKEEDRDLFDNMMGNLYDWGDLVIRDGWPQGKMCWIETGF